MVRIFNWLAGASGLLGGIAVVSMMVLINLDVMGANLFQKPIKGTMELVSTYMMVGVSFLPLMKVEHDNGHIGVDLLMRFLGPSTRLRLIAVSGLITALFFFALAYSGWNIAVKKFNVGEYAMGARFLPVWPARFMVPLGASAMALFVLYKSWRLMLLDPSFAPEDTLPEANDD